MKKLINPSYEYLSRALDVFKHPDYFDTCGECLHEGRNVIKRFRLEGVDVVVKRYGHFTLFNRLMYSTVRKSKAMRAYLYASRLRKLDIGTPEEIAVLETRSCGILRDTYFVSAYSDWHSLYFLRQFTYDWIDVFPLLDALASWLLEVHDKGVLHMDLNVGNILYKDCGEGKYMFRLIDNNRMKFQEHLSVNERLKNLCKLSANFELHNYIVSKYAEQLPYDCGKIEMKGGFYKLKIEYRQMAKQRIKKTFKSLFALKG